METTTEVKEAHCGCSSNLVPESVESPTKIDSISMDLINANDIDSKKCEHFSIRGYVSEMRKKDWKKGWPFLLDSGQNIFKEQSCKLPPLLVPKFSWWRCRNCLQETEDKYNINEGRTVTNNSSKLKSFSSCSHVPSCGDDVTCLSKMQQAGKINAESRRSGAIPCVNVHSCACPRLVGDKSEKKAENGDIPVRGKTDILENSNNKEISISNNDGIEDISSLMRKTFRLDEKVTSLQLHNPDLKDNEIAGAKLLESNVECIVKDATETCQTGKSACDQQMELVKGSESHGIASTVHWVPDAIKTHRDEHPSLELDEFDYASSESDEVLPGTVSGSLHRRKNCKVRLLTELLGKSKDEKTNLTSTEDSPSSTFPDAPIGIDSISASQGQVNSQGNVTSSLTRRKKRKMPQDEEWVPREFVCSPNNGHKNLKSFNRDAETNDGITSSDSEGTTNRSSSETPAKSNLVKAKVNKSLILGKKKIKKRQNFNGFLSLHLSRDNLQKERQKKALGDTTKSDVIDIVLNKSNVVSTGSGLNPIPESAAKAEKKSTLLRKKSKIQLDHDGKASRVPWNNDILREGPILRETVEIGQSENVAVPFEETRDALAENGQGHVLSEYNIKRKGLNMNYVTQADAYVWKGMHVDLNSNQTTDKIPFLNQKHDRFPAEVGSSLIHLMDFSGTRNNGKTVKFQDHATVSSREHYDKHVEMAAEQESADDIMEIAELMAKNQYERCLPDTEIDKQLPETSNAKNHLKVDLNKAYGNEEMSLFQETTDKPKPQDKNGRIDKFLGGDNVGSSKQKLVDYFSHIDRSQCSMSQLEQSYSPASFSPFPLCGEKPLNGVQFSATNSIKQNSAQNFPWVENMAGQKTSHANMQELGVCNTCHRVPQQNKEAAHLWPSKMPNSMPYIPSIPHKCAGQVANLDVLRHCPSSLPKGNMSRNDDQNFLNLGSNYEKPCRKFDCEALRRTHADYTFSCKHNGMGSLDLYSNETIPAMHLLSLMDAGLQSGAPVDVDGNQRFVKGTSFLPGHHSKELSSMPSGGCRTNSMKHLPFDCYGKSHLTGGFCECMSATAAVDPFTPSFQHDKSFNKASEFTGQFALKSRKKEKNKWSDSQRQNKNKKSQKAVSSNTGLNTTCGSIPVHSMPKMALENSEFIMFPGNLHAMQRATKQKQKAHTSSGTLFHPKSGSENGTCSINRNPADFTVPEAGNMYMIGSEDLKFGRAKAPSSSSAKLVGHKSQRKLTVRKEHSRNRTSWQNPSHPSFIQQNKGKLESSIRCQTSKRTYLPHKLNPFVL